MSHLSVQGPLCRLYRTVNFSCTWSWPRAPFNRAGACDNKVVPGAPRQAHQTWSYWNCSSALSFVHSASRNLPKMDGFSSQPFLLLCYISVPVTVQCSRGPCCAGGTPTHLWEPAESSDFLMARLHCHKLPLFSSTETWSCTFSYQWLYWC